MTNGVIPTGAIGGGGVAGVVEDGGDGRGVCG